MNDKIELEQLDWWTPGRIPSGHEGLDALLFGGFPKGRMTLIEGSRRVTDPLLKNTTARICHFDELFSGKMCDFIAKRDNIALIVQVQDENVTKDAKFHAYLRLKVSEEGVLKVLKDMTSPRQGYTLKL